MQKDERDQLVAQYADGYRAVADALVKITPEQLDARPAAGTWSARQNVHHLADSEMGAAIRLRLLLAEDRPAIRGYDQDRFAQVLHYERPHEASLDLFRAARASTTELLGCLTEADWLREGTHSEMGRFGVETWLRTYAPHAHRHADQIRIARGTAKTT
jgi:hypothetical protein